MHIKLLKIRLQEEFQALDETAANYFLANNQILQLNAQLITEDHAYWSILVNFEDQKKEVKEQKQSNYKPEQQDLMNADEVKILDSLKLWRSEKAKEQKLPHYMIASNNELINIVKFKPAKKEELIEIKGFGKYKVENFGSEILEILELQE